MTAEHPAQAPPARVPAQPPAAPPTISSTTAWWIAAGVIIVALAVAAGILVGLNLARRGPAGAAGATCGPEFAPVVERAAQDVGAELDGCKLVRVTTTQLPAG